MICAAWRLEKLLSVRISLFWLSNVWFVSFIREQSDVLVVVNHIIVTFIWVLVPVLSIKTINYYHYCLLCLKSFISVFISPLCNCTLIIIYCTRNAINTDIYNLWAKLWIVNSFYVLFLFLLRFFLITQ